MTQDSEVFVAILEIGCRSEHGAVVTGITVGEEGNVAAAVSGVGCAQVDGLEGRDRGDG